MRLRYWIIGLPIAVVLALAALQLRSVTRLRAVDAVQLHTVAMDGAQGVAWDFNHEMARAYDWFRADTATLRGDVWEEFNFEYAAWQERAPQPKLFRAWYLVTDDGAHGLVLRKYVPERGRFVAAAWSEELAPIRAVIEQENQHRLGDSVPRFGFQPRIGPEFDTPAALLLPVLPATVADPRPIYGYQIGLLDMDHVTSSYLPSLVRDNLADDTGLHFDYEFVLKRDPSHVLIPAAAPLGKPDVDVDLFRVGFAHLSDRFIDADEDGLDDGLWLLRATRHGGGIAAHVARQKRNDLILTAGVFVLLLASVLLLLAAARRARRMAAQQLTFVAGITHELRTPLAVIRSAAENLADGVITDRARVQRYGELLLGEGRRLSHMVEQAIDFAALEAGATRPAPEEVYDVAELVADLVKQRHADVRTRIAAPLPALRGDPVATRLVLGNLVENARKHAPGAPIAIHVDAVASPAGSAVRIEVVDRGGGIDAADVPHLFEPFYRGRHAREQQVPGSGLGLSVVKRLIEQQRGTISVRSQPGQGSSFIVHLPGGQ